MVYDATKEAHNIQLTHTEVPLEDDIIDTLCFQSESQRTNWFYRIKEFSLCAQ